MLSFNVNMKTVGKIARRGCSILVFALGTIAPYVSAKDVKDMMRWNGDIKYNDVIGVIMESSMFASDKRKIVALVPKDADAETYRSIIRIVDSDMFSSDKIKTIETVLQTLL